MALYRALRAFTIESSSVPVNPAFKFASEPILVSIVVCVAVASDKSEATALIADTIFK